MAELPVLTCCIARLCSAEGETHSVRDDHGMVNRSITVSTYFLVSVVLMSPRPKVPVCIPYVLEDENGEFREPTEDKYVAAFERHGKNR